MMNEKYINRLITLLPLFIAILLPEWGYAQVSDASNHLNFNPPVQDISVIFLSNIFGVVDGVLHGTGSQIIGQMFGVFNSAVLALGGTVLVYTTCVGTMNTAHEGEMLGKKWSSIWIPVRSVFGIGLLIPKATGYCVMQVMVMWIVVQGVGAADKVWDAALSYLQRGGVIIQPNVDPSKAFNMGGNKPQLAAQNILTGQVCMAGLEQLLTNIQKKELQNTSASSLCKNPTDEKTQKFCRQAPGSFIGSVNLSDATVANRSPGCPKGTEYCVAMPNLDPSSIYSDLNGVCGYIKWNGLDVPANGMTQGEVETSNKSRNIALQQMYDTLSNVAESMVQNDPKINDTLSCADNACVASDRAKNAFGVPLSQTNAQCSVGQCTVWGLPGAGGVTLLTGTEFQGSVQDYAGIMLPTLQNLQHGGDDNIKQEKAFITQARQEGWLMAGAYFFKLAQLNSSQSGSDGLDSGAAKNSGLAVQDKAGGDVSIPGIQDSLSKSKCNINGTFFCTILDGKVGPLITLLNNNDPTWTTINGAVSAMNGKLPYYNGKNSNTTFSYIMNAGVLTLPGQAGLTPPTFEMHFNFSPSAAVHKLPPASFSGGFMGIPGAVTTLIYNGVARFVFNLLLEIAMPIVTQLFFMLVSPPIMILSSVFNSAVVKLQDPTINPILALAQMGGAYINGVGELWVMMAATVAGFGMLPPVFALIIMVMPVVAAWMGVMLGVGINCAYYVPFIPYLLFIFGVFAWMVAVIEAMVAAPIVALGVTHPEGHEAFGKGEQAIMLVLNVFLRPAMMIFGYIFGIILSYVGVWLINTGYSLTLGDIYNIGAGNTGPTGQYSAGQGAASGAAIGLAAGGVPGAAAGAAAGAVAGAVGTPVAKAMAGMEVDKNYTQWTGLFMYFFSILIYTGMYIAVVQKSFQLIYMLPDKVLRWIGGQQESFGSEIAGSMAKEVESTAKQGEAATKEGLQALSKPPKQGGGGESGGGGPQSGGSGGAPPGGGAAPPGGVPPIPP